MRARLPFVLDHALTNAGPLNNTLAVNIVVNFSSPFYWGECECCPNSYHHGDREHRRWMPGFCDRSSPNNPGGVCSQAPNAAGMFALAEPWTNSSAHFDVRPTNAIMARPGFVSSDLEKDLNFELSPSSPAYKLGWKTIPERDIGPDLSNLD